MIEELRRVCELQPSYSSTNTPEMRERGEIIRRRLPVAIRESEAELRLALGRFGAEFDIGASDGIGRKTEAPWVRFFAKSMAPTPRAGFYTVIHFAADGSAVFITLGCGSTIWANGDLRAESDDALAERTDWARQVVSEQFGSLNPFLDRIDLGAQADLPRTFEKATVVAKRILVGALDEVEVRDLLVQSAERLREVYEAQNSGFRLKTTAIAEIELEAISRPVKTAVAGQGFGLSAVERKAVEKRAMVVTREWLEAEGYTVTDRSKNSPFDFEATKGSATLKIEVKGTTTDGNDAIFMTKNEVDLHTREIGSTGIVIVSGIRLEAVAGKPLATGGELHSELGWDIRTWSLMPLAYRVIRITSP